MNNVNCKPGFLPQKKHCDDDIVAQTIKGSNKTSPVAINIETLIGNLEDLKNKRYIFRGQHNKNYYLQPSVFREGGIEKLSKDFPNFLQKEWCSLEKVKKLSIIMSGFLNEKSLNRFQGNIRRVFELTIFIMKYNHKLALFVEEHRSMFDEKTRKYYEIHPSSDWTTEEALRRVFGENLDAITVLIGLDGELLKRGEVYKVLTSCEESLPQHYGVPTAALDWTYDPYKAIFFALWKMPENVEQFSIYAYKEINSSDRNPILIKQGSFGVENPRLIAQEGVFTCFYNPCYFYYSKGRWPKIEDCFFYSQNNFELIKYCIPKYHCEYLHDLLNQKNITNKALLLD